MGYDIKCAWATRAGLTHWPDEDHTDNNFIQMREYVAQIFDNYFTSSSWLAEQPVLANRRITVNLTNVGGLQKTMVLDEDKNDSISLRKALAKELGVQFYQTIRIAFPDGTMCRPWECRVLV